MNANRMKSLLPAAVLLALQGCGGGGSSAVVVPGSSTPPTATSISAATATATGNATCQAIAPFYWEIGDKDGAMASDSTGDGSVTATTPMLIASASKWIFGAYVVERHSGVLTTNDLYALTMRAGYQTFSYDACLRLSPVTQAAETVHECFTSPNLTAYNNTYTPPPEGAKFYYGGGHFQWLADTDLGLGPDNSAQLATDVAAYVGQDFAFTYDSPQLAAGVRTTADDYAIFLRKIINNQLRIGALLGSNAVCTNPANCTDAAYTPVPQTESWHYSLAHWVEDDPTVGDGSFSSPGAFGFYPWIDKTRTYYGVLARYESNPGAPVTSSPYYQSVVCGRAIRKAWFTGVQQ
jgi:hypothetical protein